MGSCMLGCYKPLLNQDKLSSIMWVFLVKLFASSASRVSTCASNHTSMLQLENENILLFLLANRFVRLSKDATCRSKMGMFFRIAILMSGRQEAIMVPVCRQWVIPNIDIEIQATSAIEVLEVEVEDWKHSLIDYLQFVKLPEDPKHMTKIRHRVPRFLYFNNKLYRCSFNDAFMRYLGNDEDGEALE
ncbi:hypothetical protein HHK36_024336 [Tetracentron sinense]|uniref:Uncharacterized protein n=1 Tax=Tetracentron sinense TaxID=13715 RepID=A0A834YK27_TETSI|nr:hypothetical protein HHK36_024336 [Tetracentron sinense]